MSDQISSNDFEKLDALVTNGLAKLHEMHFEVGMALTQIRDERLYKGQFETFEKYVKARHDISRAHAYRLITTAEIQASVSNGDKLLKESHCRELAIVPAEKRRDLLEQVGDNLTARALRDAATPYRPEPRKPTKQPSTAYESVEQRALALSKAEMRRLMKALAEALGDKPATNRPLTAQQLIDLIPDDYPEVLKPIAIEWAQDKQSRPAADRYRSAMGWQKNLARMRTYDAAVLREAVDQAIAAGWKGWEHDSLKQQTGKSLPKPRVTPIEELI